MAKIQKLSVAEINQMNKETLKSTLKEILSNLAVEQDKNSNEDDDGCIKLMLQQVLDEVKAIRAERIPIIDSMTDIQEKIVAQDKEINELKSCHSNLSKTVEYHQRMLEQVDAKQRECNVIVMGLKEDVPLDGALADDEKCNKIFEQIEVNIGFQVKRLGKQGEYPRPLLVITKSPDDRAQLIDNAKKLKEAGEDYKNVYIKKDLHPAVRKE
jgi:Zn-dependent M32 family carboxypeptidase